MLVQTVMSTYALSADERALICFSLHLISGSVPPGYSAPASDAHPTYLPTSDTWYPKCKYLTCGYLTPYLETSNLQVSVAQVFGIWLSILKKGINLHLLGYSAYLHAVNINVKVVPQKGSVEKFQQVFLARLSAHLWLPSEYCSDANGPAIPQSFLPQTSDSTVTSTSLIIQVTS